MWPYILALIAALLFAVGAVVEQRVAFDAPAGTSLRIGLLWWLVRQPRWLAGIGASLVGNLCSAAALSMAGVALVQPLLVARLLFAVPLSAAWARQRLSGRDWLGMMAAAGGLATFILVARPSDPVHAPVDALRWILAAAALVGLTAGAFAAGRLLTPTVAAPLLGGTAGALFGMQAALTYTAVSALGDDGLGGMLGTSMTYGIPVTALAGTLLAQSAFEMAPLPSSYPALAAVEPLVGVVLGVLVLGSTLTAGAGPLGVGMGGLAAMTLGVVLLATSPLVTGERDAIDMRAEEEAAAALERQLEQRLTRLERADIGPGVPQLDPGVTRLVEQIDSLTQEMDALHEQFRASYRHAASRPGGDHHREVMEQWHRLLREREARVRDRMARLAQRDPRLARRPPEE